VHFNEYIESSSKKLVGNIYCMHICPVNRDKPNNPKYLLNMKKITFILFALIAGTAFAQVGTNTATSNAQASAGIVTAIAITENTALNFGDVVTDGLVGKAIMTSAGGLSATGGATLISSINSAAEFEVTAAEGVSFVVTVPLNTDAAILLTNGIGTDMLVNDFEHDAGTSTFVVVGDGTKLVHVGATLNLNTSQEDGHYTGSYPVTVAYQ